jgi:pimeloyl-ACP methyl ester carboxylesterase
MSDVEFVDIDWAGRPVRIEHRWLRRSDRLRPLIVFLHEGLGSVSMWRDFPARLCDALGCRGLVYSRPGYGRSTPRAAEEAWGLDFMHRQAHEVLPACCMRWASQANRPGCSATATAARSRCCMRRAMPRWPARWCWRRTSGSRTCRWPASRRRARPTAHRPAPAPDAPYHDDPDSAFHGWNDIWLHPPFRHWSIEDEIGTITCPLLAVQGLDDEYGTLEQIRGIARRVPQTQLLELPACGHSPHKDQPEAVIDAARALLARACPAN